MKAERIPLVGYRDPARNQTLVPVEVHLGEAGNFAQSVISLWNGKVYRWHRGRL
jgi:hypothetical protein